MPSSRSARSCCVMYDARTKLADQVVSEVRDHFGDKVLRAVVPRSVRLSEAPSFGPADHHVRSLLARGDRLSRRRQGGARWLGAAGWVGDSSSLIPDGRRGPIGGRRRRPILTDDPVDEIVPNPHQPRRALRRGGARRARRRRSPRSACSSRCWCAAIDDGYQLIAGERRWRAARRAGLADRSRRSCATPTTSAAVEQALVENLHRQDLTAARGGRRLPAADRGLRADPRRRRPSESARAVRRSPTRCACSGCRRRCSSCSPTASSPPDTPGRCSARRIARSRSSSPGRWSARAGRCAPSRTPCARGSAEPTRDAGRRRRRRAPRPPTAPA